MTFKTKKDCKLWCEIANQLSLKVERHTIRYGYMCHQSLDPRLRALSRSIYDLHKDFHKRLHAAMEEIRKRESEFVIDP